MKLRYTRSSFEVEEKLLELPQHLLYNTPDMQRMLYQRYKEYLVDYRALVVEDDAGKVAAVVPMGIDPQHPGFGTPAWNYLGSIVNSPGIASSYPVDPASPLIQSGEWLDALPDWYMDADITLELGARANVRRAAVPTASMRLEDSGRLFDEHGRSRRKDLRRALHILDDYEYVVEPGTLEDVYALEYDTVQMWTDRVHADASELGFQPPLEIIANVLAVLEVAQAHSHSDVIVHRVTRADRLEAVTAVVRRDGDVYDDHLCWRRRDNTHPLGKAMALWNILNLAPSGRYNMGSPYYLGEVFNHHQYKLDIIPESLRLPMHLVCTVPTQRIAESLQIPAPYRTRTGWVLPETTT